LRERPIELFQSVQARCHRELEDLFLPISGSDTDLRMSYPYLRQPMIDLALRRACRWPQSGDLKRALKEAFLRV
jgi:hypothetical protein